MKKNSVIKIEELLDEIPSEADIIMHYLEKQKKKDPVCFGNPSKSNININSYFIRSGTKDDKQF